MEVAVGERVGIDTCEFVDRVVEKTECTLHARMLANVSSYDNRFVWIGGATEQAATPWLEELSRGQPDGHRVADQVMIGAVIRARALALTVVASGVLTIVLSCLPFAQAAGDPGQANFAGPVTSERRQLLSLGLVLACVGAVAFAKRQRWPLAVSLIAAVVVGVVAVQTIDDVAEVVASSEADSDVGWALYGCCACAVVGMVSSTLGLSLRQRAGQHR